MRIRALALALLLAVPVAARAQLSPGPLAEPHRALEGATQCYQCHARGAGVVDAKCLACHGEIAWTRARGRGLHARVTATPCAKCHPDHAGRDFALVRWDEGAPERFDHRRTGYALEGKHAGLACAKCHQPALQRSGAAPLIRKRDHARSWLGLEPACASCHEDPHRGQVGADCTRCHGQQAWKPAAGFDHAKTAYPLTGKHVSVACVACHGGPRGAAAAGAGATTGSAASAAPAGTAAAGAAATTVLRFKPVAHADCASCHRDPHAGRFAGACARCHSTAGFGVVDKRGFDHDRTRWPLRGAHAALECGRCHDAKTAWGERPPFDRCGSCHEDAHAGRATLAGRAADCAACHTVQAWTPSTYTVAAHRAAWPLEGRHAAAACALCHDRAEGQAAVAAWGSSRVRLRPAHQQCVDCHVDPHGGRYAAGGARPQADGCRACHSMTAYVPATLGPGDHARYGWALEGAHLAVPCQACHAELKAARARSTLKGAAARTLPFTGATTDCAGCHKNPHGTQFAARAATVKGAPGDACERCHGLEAFRPASRFDHERDAAFRLGGAHARVPCLSCHKSARDASGTVRVTYVPTPARCQDCHALKKAQSGAAGVQG